MPRYDAKRIESKWQTYWDAHDTFVTPNAPPKDSHGKLYVLDMFPYPSGAGLHVGHPEGYTATDIVCRQARMQGKHVLHPMGWDAFGLPAEQHAINTGTHPQVTTNQNIDNFRRQLKMLGFSYDWSREISTTDEDYYRWTQWIFLQLFNSWFDPDMEWTGPDGVARQGKGRPISELPIPHDVEAAGSDAVRAYRDQHRLAYQSEAPVNWCPALGTVLANEEVNSEGKSERGNHPVERRALRQWMLRITSYAERLLNELEPLDWPESVKILQRNWIGKSVGAEVDFLVDTQGVLEKAETSEAFDSWKQSRSATGYPATPEDNVLRVFTTRPDTLFGATYMVLAPEHPLVERITFTEQHDAVEDYRRKAALKSDLDRTDLAKEKTGVFTGSYAFNPVNGERVPIWIADYVLSSYGTGAIMAVPAHDERDWEFAQRYDLPVVEVVQSPEDHRRSSQELVDALNTAEDARVRALQSEATEIRHKLDAATGSETGPAANIQNMQLIKQLAETELSLSELMVASLHSVYTGPGVAMNSGRYDGLETAEFKRKITEDLHKHGLGRQAVNYRLRDWLFSRQRYWGEPFPIWHELDADGNLTGRVRPVAYEELPVTLPEMEDFKPKGTPDPPLSWAPDDWLYRTAEDGVRLKRETNSMPQWAGSCWYYLRFADNKNTKEFLDPDLEQYWLPVDLYIGGAEHAVLHLLYSRFWHKVLFDLGHVSTPEPFGKLVNQGMILGEAEITGARTATGEWISTKLLDLSAAADGKLPHPETGEPLEIVKLEADQVVKKGDGFVLKDQPEIAVESRAFKMSKSRGNVINPDDVVQQYGADSLRLYEMFMGPLEQVKPWSMSGVEGVFRFLGRVWRMIADADAAEVVLNPAVKDVEPTPEQDRILHKTIQAVTDDIQKLSFNTAISRMMEFTNAFTSFTVRPRSAMESFVLLLAPFAPHLAEELWEVLGHSESLSDAPWPQSDPSRIAEAEIEIPVQFNGKVRTKIRVPADADAQTLQSLAEQDEAVQGQLVGKTLVKVICVPGRMVNFVVKGK